MGATRRGPIDPGGMAWGYWSATSVGDRGRSPRRDKDKQSLQQQAQHQQQQQLHETPGDPVQSCSGVQQQLQQAAVELENVLQVGEAAQQQSSTSQIPGAGALYSYSLAAAAAAAAAGRRTPGVVEGSTSSGMMQMLPRDIHSRPGSSNYPPSPGSDSAEYEQPTIALHSAYVQQHESDPDLDSMLVPPPAPQSASSILTATRLKMLRGDEPDDDITDAELEEEAAVAEIIYASNSRAAAAAAAAGLPPGGCLVHGPCGQMPDSTASMSSLISEQYPAGSLATYSSQVWLNDITWGTSLNAVYSSFKICFSSFFFYSFCRERCKGVCLCFRHDIEVLVSSDVRYVWRSFDPRCLYVVVKYGGFFLPFFF